MPVTIEMPSKPAVFPATTQARRLGNRAAIKSTPSARRGLSHTPAGGRLSARLVSEAPLGVFEKVMQERHPVSETVALMLPASHARDDRSPRH